MAVNSIRQDAEYSVLGSLILDPEYCAADIFSQITAEDFADGPCRHLYQTACGMYAQGIPVDAVSLVAKAGAEYRELVMQLMEVTPTAANYREYVAILREQSRRAAAYEQAVEISNLLMSGAAMGEVQLAAEQLQNALTAGQKAKGVGMPEMLIHFFQGLNQPRSFLDWGYRKLNEHLYTEAGDYIVLAARPSIGKTALAINLAAQIAQSKRVTFFSLETGESKFFDRMMAALSDVRLSDLKKSRCDAKDVERLVHSKKRLQGLPIRFVYAAGFTVDDIRAETLKTQAQVIFIDYVGLLEHPNAKLSDYGRMSDISRKLHILSQRYGVTIIALCQLNRAGVGQPTMANLRDSGQIEQDADVIMLLSRPEDEDVDPSKDPRRILKIEKNKEGICGAIQMTLQLETQKIIEGWPETVECRKDYPHPEFDRNQMRIGGNGH
jgi:replicative DNA helicase